MKRAGNLFPLITDFNNLLIAFKKAFKGTNKTEETLRFHFHMEKELLNLRYQLQCGEYAPGQYRLFKIFEPKERTIAVAPFKDRVVHHAIVNVIEPVYEKTFIYDSYATRKDKGTHKAILRAQSFLKTNKWFLKADVRKYFESVDHRLLINLLERKIKDKDVIKLLHAIVQNGGDNGKGLPVGNLTSQFLANVYLDPFDHYIKNRLSIKHYVRYMDDFVIFDNDKEFLKNLRHGIGDFLSTELKLQLKPNATFINQRLNGLSFLGARIFPKLLRIKRESLKRCLKKVNKRLLEWDCGLLPEDNLKMSLSSVIGYMSFFDTAGLRQDIDLSKRYWFE